jgi:hypothetical protein
MNYTSAGCCCWPFGFISIDQRESSSEILRKLTITVKLTRNVSSRLEIYDGTLDFRKSEQDLKRLFTAPKKKINNKNKKDVMNQRSFNELPLSTTDRL